MKQLSFALRMLWRERSSGDIRILCIALTLAVAAATSVEFFTDRISVALSRQANALLGADLMVRSMRPINPNAHQLAQQLKLETSESLNFPSMLLANGRSLLVAVNAVKNNFPLRGEIKISRELFTQGEAVSAIPAPGTLWAESRVLAALGLKVGERIQLGNKILVVNAVLVSEPGAGGGLFNIAPHIMINHGDIAATGLIQPGSRVSYRLLLAGQSAAIDTYYQRYSQRSYHHDELITAQNARPEIRSALTRAERFLNLAALTAIVIAGVAIAVAARSFVHRHILYSGVLRGLGASQYRIGLHYCAQIMLLGMLFSLAGCIAGFLLQHAVSSLLAVEFDVQLPAVTWRPWLSGWLLGMCTLIGFALPPLFNLRNVPALWVLRADKALPSGAFTGFTVAAVVFVLLAYWQAGDWILALYVVGASAALFLLLGIAAFVIIKLLGRLALSFSGIWRFGFIYASRRVTTSVLQIVALGCGLMALLLLGVVRQDLLTQWQDRLPAQAPNRFVINIQHDQIKPVKAFFEQRGMTIPDIYPMVRGRLVSINDRTVAPSDYENHRAQRLLQREFNLSWARELPGHNRLLAGQWWSQDDQQQLSLEQGIAELLGIKLGDQITFDVAGSRFQAKVSSLRQVDWDSFKVNFFVITAPSVLDKYPAGYITSFYVPAQHGDVLNDLVAEFPNVTIIDVAAVMDHVRGIITRVVQAVEFVFLFTLVAGILVLVAALRASLGERLRENSIMRVLGASSGQARKAWLAEFVAIGLGAGVCASAVTSVIAGWFAYSVLKLNYVPHLSLWLIGIATAVFAVTVVGLTSSQSVLRRPPLRSLSRS